jgi:hypothetical protein
MIRLSIFVALFASLFVGCARYEYDLRSPENEARHIGAKADEIVSIDPLEYRLRTVDNRLVMRIYNPTQDMIAVQGAPSVVVDPSGQSHPLRDQTIAPSSFVKLIFPPLRPTIENVGPTWGVGVGVGAHTSRRDYGLPDNYYPYDPAPRYYSVYDGSDYYWDWNGSGDLRVVLSFRRGDKEFRHEFVFRRQKMS